MLAEGLVKGLFFFNCGAHKQILQEQNQMAIKQFFQPSAVFIFNYFSYSKKHVWVMSAKADSMSHHLKERERDDSRLLTA